MIQFIKKYIFGGRMKSTNAAQIFLILCFYMVFTSVYALIVVDAMEMLLRLGFGMLIVVSFIVFERSRLSKTVTAVISPVLITSVIYVGAVMSGDVLIFIYIVGCAMFSLTYLKPKSLMYYIVYNAIVGGVLVLSLQINLLGGVYSFVHNAIFFVATIALCILVFVFCLAYSKNIESLTEAQNKAALLAQAKGNFLARMSHEIRTPLNAIVGLTELQLRKDLPADQQVALNKIQSSGTLLLGIINDILDLSKIESGKFDLVAEEYVTADVINDIINLNMVRIGQKPIRFEVDIDKTIPCRLVGDSLRIKQLLSNLLSNAFKYTREGVVKLTLGWEGGGDEIKLIFKIIDTGIGLSDEDQSCLFSEYAQVNRKANKAVEGTGLGLSICKSLTELMGGSISVESRLGSGSTFTAEIMQKVENPNPIGAKNAEALGKFSYTPEQNEIVLEFVEMPYARVLVVDDVELNLLVAEALMEPYGMTVDLLTSGKEAVDRIAAGGEYDLIFMDHMMPGMDGIETVTAIRALPAEHAKSVPVVALSANAIAGSEKMFLESGFQGFLAKPIDTLKLDTTLRKYVMKKQ